MIVTCPCCGTTFDIHKRNEPRQLIEKTCNLCGKPYKTYDDARQFCSRACNGINRRSRATAEEVAMYERYQKGESMRAIGRAHGITGQRVQIIFQRNGYAVRPSGPVKRGKQP